MKTTFLLLPILPSNKFQIANNILEMSTEQILEKYGLTKETTQQYIDAITRLNQTQTADELDVSRDTINRYKNAFAEMTGQERTLLITSLEQNKLLKQTTE